MSADSVAVSIQILDKDYMVSCPEEEREALEAAARYLNDKMRETRDSGKVIGTERIAVMSALNIVHEFLRQRRDQSVQVETVEDDLKRLRNKIDSVLTRRADPEGIH